MTLPRATLGELLKHARRTAGLTQEALAARAGLSARAISDLERNVSHVPRPATVQLLIGALSLSDQEREQFEAAASFDRNPGSSADEGMGDGSEARSRWPAGSAASVSTPPLTGRASERALLERMLAGEDSPLLVIGGEAGIGKTRLLQEAASLATARGLEVLQGAVSSTGQDEPRDPLVDALRKAVARRSPLHLRQDLQGCAWLVRALPELAFGPIQPLPLESLPPEQEVVLTVRAVTRFLSNVAGPAGVLLTLDNLQYADAAALAALARLVRSAADVPLRIIGAYRDGDMASGDGLSWLFASLAQDQLMRHATLRPLSMDDAADLLLATLLEPGRISAKWLQGVLDASGGVPFYLVAWAQELNLLRAEPADNYVPWSIRQSVRYRIDAAPPAVALVLEAIAAAGGRASYPLLVALTAQPEETLLSALDAAVRARLVDEDGQAYLFAYEVIRHVVEADLSHARRLVLRRRLTAVIPRESGSVWGGRSPGTQGRAATDAAERAYHLAVLRRHRTPSGVPKPPPPTI